MTYHDRPMTSDSVNLGSNPSSPATTSVDKSGTSGPHRAAEQPELTERTAHIGRTQAGTAHKPRDAAAEALKILRTIQRRQGNSQPVRAHLEILIARNEELARAEDPDSPELAKFRAVTQRYAERLAMLIGRAQ